MKWENIKSKKVQAIKSLKFALKFSGNETQHATNSHL